MKINENVSLLVALERSRLTTDGKAPIFVRHTVDGKRAEMSLGQKVHLQNWDQDIGYVRGASVEARLINNDIDAATLKIRQLETVSAMWVPKSINTTQIYAKMVAQKISTDMG